MRMTRIVYAFRNKVWPKPMEGLDLFIPSVKPDASSSSDESSHEGDALPLYSSEEDIDLDASDSDCQFIVSTKRAKRPRRAKAMAKLVPGMYREDMVVEGESVVWGGGERKELVPMVRRDFEIERSQGLKLTLKKANTMTGITATAAAGLVGRGGAGGGASRRDGTHQQHHPELMKVSELHFSVDSIIGPDSADLVGCGLITGSRLEGVHCMDHNFPPIIVKCVL